MSFLLFSFRTRISITNTTNDVHLVPQQIRSNVNVHVYPIDCVYFAWRLRFCLLLALLLALVFFLYVALNHLLELTHFLKAISLDVLRESLSVFASITQLVCVHQIDSSSPFPQVVDVHVEHHSCGY